MCHGNTTHMIVLYDEGVVVGGALLRSSPNVVIVKRLCTAKENIDHIEIIIKYLQRHCSSMDLHISVSDDCLRTLGTYGFTKKNRSRMCLCKINKKMTHLVWVSKHIIKPNHSGQ